MKFGSFETIGSDKIENSSVGAESRKHKRLHAVRRCQMDTVHQVKSAMLGHARLSAFTILNAFFLLENHNRARKASQGKSKHTFLDISSLGLEQTRDAFFQVLATVIFCFKSYAIQAYVSNTKFQT